MINASVLATYLDKKQPSRRKTLLFAVAAMHQAWQKLDNPSKQTVLLAEQFLQDGIITHNPYELSSNLGVAAYYTHLITYTDDFISPAICVAFRVEIEGFNALHIIFNCIFDTNYL